MQNKKLLYVVAISKMHWFFFIKTIFVTKKKSILPVAKKKLTMAVCTPNLSLKIKSDLLYSVTQSNKEWQFLFLILPAALSEVWVMLVIWSYFKIKRWILKAWHKTIFCLENSFNPIFKLCFYGVNDRSFKISFYAPPEM